MNKYWPDQEVLMVGHKLIEFTPPQNYKYISVGLEKNYNWSDRIMKILKVIKDELFIMFLEDYFICSPINKEEIENRIKFMLENKEIGKIDLSNQIYTHGTSGNYNNSKFLIAKSNAEYLMSFQPAIWRREFFLKYLKPNKSAWEVEVGSSEECKKEKYYKLLGTRENLIPNVNAVIKGKINMQGTLMRNGKTFLPGISTIENYLSIPGINNLNL